MRKKEKYKDFRKKSINFKELKWIKNSRQSRRSLTTFWMDKALSSLYGIQSSIKVLRLLSLFAEWSH